MMHTLPASPDAPARSVADDGFVLGVNLPWRSYGGDFGANAWQPAGGVARPETRTLLEDVFGGLAADGVRWVRWFLLCDGRAGIVWSPDGTPVGLDERILPDLDAALDLARGAGLRIVFALFDFLWFHQARHVGAVQLGGHADVVTDPTKRELLLERVVDPILTRAGPSSVVSAWDVVNEPEWVTCGGGTWGAEGCLAAADMQAFIGSVVEHIHARSPHQATVGLASARGLPLVRGLGLDLYQVHWYDAHDKDSPLDRPVDTLALDRPLLLGEFPTRGSARSVGSILGTARSMGYAGAMAWSALAADAASDYYGRSAEIAAWRREPVLRA